MKRLRTLLIDEYFSHFFPTLVTYIKVVRPGIPEYVKTWQDLNWMNISKTKATRSFCRTRGKRVRLTTVSTDPLPRWNESGSSPDSTPTQRFGIFKNKLRNLHTSPPQILIQTHKNQKDGRLILRSPPGETLPCVHASGKPWREPGRSEPGCDLWRQLEPLSWHTGCVQGVQVFSFIRSVMRVYRMHWDPCKNNQLKHTWMGLYIHWI